jgi:hypothetical protein
LGTVFGDGFSALGTLRLSFPDVQWYGTQLLVINIQYEVYHTAVGKVQVGEGKYQMGYGGGGSFTMHVHMAGDGLNIQFPVQVHRLNPEIMGAVFPHIKAHPDNHRQLGVNAGKIPGDDRVEGSHYGKFPAVFLGKIAERKYFGFHVP